MQNVQRATLRRERLLVFVFTCIVALATAHFVHEAWGEFFAMQHASPFASGKSTGGAVLHAPEAYRVAMPALLRLLSHLLPAVPPPFLFAALDAVCLGVALPLVYLLATRYAAQRVGPGAARSLRIALTLMFVVAALPWLAQYARPETMPTTLFLLVSVICFRARAPWSLPLQLGLTLLQAFTRSDVPLCLGLGMVLVALLSSPGEAGSRKLWTVWGLAIVLIAALAQAYLQFVRFPHLTYDPGIPAIQLLQNLRPHRWINGALAVLPITLPIAYCLMAGNKSLLDTIDRICVCAAGLYLALWFTVGALTEPRIFLPFLLLLSPLAARCVASLLHPDASATPLAEPR